MSKRRASADIELSIISIPDSPTEGQEPDDDSLGSPSQHGLLNDRIAESIKSPHRKPQTNIIFNRVKGKCIIFVVFTILLLLLSIIFTYQIIYASKSKNFSSSPNVVLIVADDLAWGTFYEDYDYENIVGSDYSPLVSNILKIRHNGVLLKNYYAQELCTPSRASLMTGKYPIHLGMQYFLIDAFAEWGLPLDEPTLPQILNSNGYSTYAVGKWNLGHYTPRYLPTSRGFDSFFGYLNAHSNYWSKTLPETGYLDIMTTNKSCYNTYDGSDLETYSSVLYGTKAIEIMKNHLHEKPNDPFFLYLAFQAVHDPFVDVNYPDGIPDKMIPNNILNTIHKYSSATRRIEYFKMLYLMDQEIGRIHEYLNTHQLLENTYIIFVSDNGGCLYTGGLNRNLRGYKGSLFEGGTKVDAVISYGKLSDRIRGTSYNGLMHVSDWLPTIISLTGIKNPEGKVFDGFDQSMTLLGNQSESPRNLLLYNMYHNVSPFPIPNTINRENREPPTISGDFDIWINGSFAVRDHRYKLIHAWTHPILSYWGSADYPVFADLPLNEEQQCWQYFHTDGNFTYFLFDLLEDPYETVNLYDSIDVEHRQVKNKLYEEAFRIARSSRRQGPQYGMISNTSEVFWKTHGGKILPWLETDSDFKPSYC